MNVYICSKNLPNLKHFCGGFHQEEMGIFFFKVAHDVEINWKTPCVTIVCVGSPHIKLFLFFYKVKFVQRETRISLR